MQLEKAKVQVDKSVERNLEDLWSLALKIHANPELAFQEYQASVWLAESMTKYGFTVTKPVGGVETAFSGDWTSPEGKGATIAILGEYDALAGVGHACGHNLMGTAAVLAGAALVEVMARENIPGTVRVIGTPAEEAGGGKIVLLENGVFDGVDVAMVTHPGSRTTLGSASIASTGLTLKFKGKPAHAASIPHEGINALDAVLQTFSAINALRQHLPAHVRIHGIITNGGQAANVVPEYAEARMIVRSADSKFQPILIEKAKNCARAGALATGATLEIEQSRTYDVNRPNKVMQELFRENFTRVGEKVEDAPGGGGSTDFGNIAQVMPGLHPSINICDTPVPGHSHEMAVASASPRAKRGLANAAKAMAMTALDIYTNPATLQAIHEEFRGGSR